MATTMTRTLAGAMLVLSLAAAAQQDNLTLAAEGQSRAAILAAPTISAAERFAVQELQGFIAQMRGAQLPVCEPGQTPPGGEPEVWIVVGRSTAEARHPDLRLGELGNEGFVIQTAGKDLVIAGSETRGTLYGVYTFLESLGCRWWSDDAGTIPALRTIRVPATNRREVPKLVYRQVLYQEQWGANLWGVRNKITNMVGGASEIPEQ